MSGIVPEILKFLNSILDAILSVIVLAGAFYLIFKNNKGSLKKLPNTPKDILLSLQSLILAGTLAAFWLLPIFFIQQDPTIDGIHWAEITIGLLIVLFFKKKKSPRRLTAFIQFSIIVLAGWWLNEGLGLLFFSLPLIGIFFVLASPVSRAVIPVSDPFSASERSKRLLIFIGYVLGMQSTAWNVSSASQREPEKRIEGSSSPIWIPDLIRLDSNQVIGIAQNDKLRIEGPGVVFTQRGDSMLEIIDLCNKQQNARIHAFSREGIPFDVDIRIEFSIDRIDKYDDSILSHINHTSGGKPRENKSQEQLFNYSSPRVQNAIRWKSSRSRPDGKPEYWDNHVATEVGAAVSNVLVQRGIDELWLAEQQSQGATEEIETQIRNQLENKLKQKGVRLRSVRLIGFDFSISVNQSGRELDVSMQQIASWNLERDREIKMEQADFIARGRIIEEQARQHARSTLLTAILKGVDDAKSHHPDPTDTKFLRVYLEILKSMIDQHLEANERSDAKEELWKAYEEFKKRGNKIEDVEK